MWFVLLPLRIVDVYVETDPTLTLKNLTNELIEVGKWYFLGIQLEVPVEKLNELESANPKDPSRCKIEAINWWLRNRPEASWAVLVEALEAMKEFGVAKTIKTKYLTGMHSIKKKMSL